MRKQTSCFSFAALSLGLGLGLGGVHQAVQAAVPDHVKKDFARAVYAACPEYIHERHPQPLLRAVIVLHVKLDENDQWQAEVVRGNEQQPEMQARAIETVRRTAPLSVPDDVRNELRQAGFMEAWLFDNDGRFQVKALAKAQQSGR